MRSWAIPTVSPRFVAKLEDILAVYQRPPDPRFPLVCLDEKGTVLHTPTRAPLPPRPGARQAGRVRPAYE